MNGCAGRHRLERFLGGDLGATASEEVAAHVERCTACQRLLDQMTSEAPEFLGIASAGEVEDAEPAPEFLERLRRTLAGVSSPPDRLIRWPREGMRSRSGDEAGESHRVHGVATPPAVAGYEIIGELSRGGMGVVYRARQVGLNRMVALKMILAGARAIDADRARFHVEAQAVARLRHPNVVQIHDIGEHDGCPYFSMELIDGPTLAQACRGRPQPARVAATMVEILARAIDCAHRQGILHRDLKPANVLLQPISSRAGWARDGDVELRDHADGPWSTASWTPKLVDFGLARRLDDVRLTQHGRILGTPSYMAPEQVDGRGRAPGPSIDVYSLGAILYELLTGRPPFLAGSIESTLALVTGEDPIPPRRLRPDVPRDLETIGLKCLEKDPSRRYETAAELADDLGRFLRGEPIRARAPSLLDRCGKFARRNAALVGGVAAVVITLALGVAATSVMAVREGRARRLADRSAGLAIKSAREAEAARTATLREAYQARLAAAMGAIGNHDIHEATRQLEAAPGELRGWEWRHIAGRLDQSLAVVTGLPTPGAVAFCPAGERIAAADGRGFRVLDAVTGQAIARHASDRPCRQVFAFRTRAGLRFALDQSDRDYVLVVADERGRPLGRIRRPNPKPTRAPVFSVVAMSPDGRRVALQTSGYSSSPLVEVFDASSGLRIATSGTSDTRLLSLDFSPDGMRLAAALESRQVFLFDAATGDPVATLSGHTGTVRAVAYSPNGRRLASCADDQTIRVWDAMTGEMLHILRGDLGRVSCVAFNPDGRRLVTGHLDSTVRLWSVEGGELALIFQGHTARVTRVAFSDDGRTIASSGQDGTARLWDATMPDDPRVLRDHEWHVYPVAYSPDGRRFASGSWDKTVRIWDATSGRPVHVLNGHARPVGALAFTADGTRLASWGEDASIRLWDAATGRPIGTLDHSTMPHRDSVYSLVVSPDGRRIGAVGRGVVRFRDPATGAELASLRLPLRGVRVLAFSPDGARMAAGGDDAKVVIVDAASGETTAELAGFAGRIQSLAFSPDGRQVLTAGQDPALRLWDAATGRLLRTFVGHSLEVLSAVFHPDGTRIASGGHDRNILIWDTASGEELVRLPGHSLYVFSLAFSPDGETLISGSGDSTVRIWDAFPVARRLRARRAAGSAGSGHQPPAANPPGLKSAFRRMIPSRRSATTFPQRAHPRGDMWLSPARWRL